jgi:hypothetical protein
MESRVVDYIERNIDEDDLPFEHLFGDKMRITIPLITDETASRILHDLKGIKDFSRIDFEKLMVVREIPLDPKYGGGKKEQSVSIGKAVQSLKIPDQTKKVYLNWLAKYGEELQSMVSGHNYSIVLTRAPIDIVRMSDHRKIGSCHSEGGSYFKCAVQEALTGGAIAYLVHGDSLSQLSEEEYQSADLFRDNDRGVRGIEPPLARLRIRRLENSHNGTELAIPELRVYGDDEIPNFYNSVRDFLQSKQNLDREKTYKDLQETDHFLRGGSYEDNSMIELVSKYFYTDEGNWGRLPYTTSITHKLNDANAEDEHKRLIGFEDELFAIQQAADGGLTECGTSYDYQDDGDVAYAMIHGWQTFDLSDIDLSEEFEAEIHQDDMDKYTDGSMGQGWKALLNHVIQMYSTASVDVVGFTVDGYNVSIVFYPNESGIIEDADDYRVFTNAMIRINRKHDRYVELLKDALEDAGFLEFDATEYSRLVEFQSRGKEDPSTWDNLQIDGSGRRSYYVTNSTQEVLFTSQKSKTVADDEASRVNDQVESMNISEDIFNLKYRAKVKMRTIIDNFYVDVYLPMRPEPDDSQPDLTGFVMEANNNVPNFGYNITNLDMYGSSGGDITLSDVDITPTNWTDDTFEVIDFLDLYWPHILNTFRVWLLDVLRQSQVEEFKPRNYPQLKAVYTKYLS